MNRFYRTLQNYLLYASPFVLICMIWSPFQEGTPPAGTSLFVKGLWEIFSWNLMLWFAALGVFFTFMIFNAGAREKTLRRIANLNERDEREEYITGKASRTVYISTLSVLIFLLFLSTVTFNIERLPQNQAVQGKTGVVNIGVKFDFFDTAKIERENKETAVLFEHKDLPLSKTGIIFILLIWQLATFNLQARKEGGKHL